jgi:hypothetical protein
MLFALFSKDILLQCLLIWGGNAEPILKIVHHQAQAFPQGYLGLPTVLRFHLHSIALHLRLLSICPFITLVT